MAVHGHGIVGSEIKVEEVVGSQQPPLEEKGRPVLEKPSNENIIGTVSEEPIILNNNEYKAIVETNNDLIKTILEYHQNGEKDEVVRNYLTKTFDGIKNNPYRNIIGENGIGWYSLFLILRECPDREAVDILISGLRNIHNIQVETGLLTLNFNLDWVVKQDPTLSLFTKRVFDVGAIIRASKIDEILEESMKSALDTAKEAVKEISKGGDSTYSASTTFWDILKWTGIAIGVAGVVYLGYKGYQALTEDDPNDVVFIDMDDYDNGHPTFI